MIFIINILKEILQPACVQKLRLSASGLAPYFTSLRFVKRLLITGRTVVCNIAIQPEIR
jgi:hypothetical protein